MNKNLNSEVKLPEVVLQIRDSIIKQLKLNLSSVLLYGSSKQNNSYWDIDFLVILKNNNFKHNDLNQLKKIASEFKDITLDLQFMYKSEIKSPNTFSLDSHGAFFTRILKRATVLYGPNPFLDFEPSKKYLLVSLVTRIQRYIFHARQEYILGSRHNKDRNPLYHQKHVIRSMFDLLMMNRKWLENIEVKGLFEERYPSVFNSKDWKILESKSDSVQDYILLYEKVYTLAIHEVYKQNI